MKTALLVDDEEDARVLIKQYLDKYDAIRIIGEADNGYTAVEMICALRPDIVFLDIQMPGLNGFQVIDSLDEVPLVIFSTAYERYAIKAFEIHAMDYLLKPYNQLRLDKAVSRILDKENDSKNTAFIEHIVNENKLSDRKIIVQKGRKKMFLKLSDIIYGEAYGDYCKIFTETTDYLSSKGISEFLLALDHERFMRVHRSYFVQIDTAIEIIRKGRYHYIQLPNKTCLKISESYLPKIKSMIV